MGGTPSPMHVKIKSTIFWNDDKKGSEFDLGSAFFGISEVDFLPYGVQMKGVIEKGLNFDKKCFLLRNFDF